MNGEISLQHLSAMQRFSYFHEGELFRRYGTDARRRGIDLIAVLERCGEEAFTDELGSGILRALDALDAIGRTTEPVPSAETISVAPLAIEDPYSSRELHRVRAALYNTPSCEGERALMLRVSRGLTWTEIAEDCGGAPQGIRRKAKAAADVLVAEILGGKLVGCGDRDKAMPKAILGLYSETNERDVTAVTGFFEHVKSCEECADPYVRLYRACQIGAALLAPLEREVYPHELAAAGSVVDVEPLAGDEFGEETEYDPGATVEFDVISIEDAGDEPSDFADDRLDDEIEQLAADVEADKAVVDDDAPAQSPEDYWADAGLAFEREDGDTTPVEAAPESPEADANRDYVLRAEVDEPAESPTASPYDWNEDPVEQVTRDDAALGRIEDTLQQLVRATRVEEPPAEPAPIIQIVAHDPIAAESQHTTLLVSQSRERVLYAQLAVKREEEEQAAEAARLAAAAAAAAAVTASEVAETEDASVVDQAEATSDSEPIVDSADTDEPIRPCGVIEGEQIVARRLTAVPPVEVAHDYEYEDDVDERDPDRHTGKLLAIAAVLLLALIFTFGSFFGPFGDQPSGPVQAEIPAKTTPAVNKPKKSKKAKKRKKRRARPAVERPVAVPIRQTPAPAPAPAPAPQPSSSGVDDGSAEFLPEGRG